MTDASCIQIEVKLFHSLRRYLPPETEGYAVSIQIPIGATVSDVFDRLGIPRELPALVLVDGIHRGINHQLHPNAVLTVLEPAGGG
jgi:hypothetical protein